MMRFFLLLRPLTGSRTGAPARVRGTAGVLLLLALLPQLAQAQAPVLTSVAPTSGPLDTRLILTGQNLTGLTSVLVGEVPARFTVAGNTQATAIVPRQATNQRVRISRAGGAAANPGTALSPTAFQVARPSTSLLFPAAANPTTDGTTPLRVVTATNVASRAAPAVTDVDGDGLLDLLVGDSEGYVSRFEQTTRNGDQFTPLGYLTTDGTTRLRLVTSYSPNNWAVPTVTDVDGDGLLDLLVGGYDGYVSRFEQTTRNGGVFAALGYLPVNTTGGSVNAGTLAAPAVTDVDGDGLLDLLVGNANGDVVRYEQAVALGSIFIEQTGAQNRLTTDGTTPVSVTLSGAGSAPVMTDLDGDGLLDLLVSNGSELVHFEQQTAGGTVFRLLNAPVDMYANLLMMDDSGYNPVAVSGIRSAAMTDVDGDGLLDLLVGSGQGFVRRFEQLAPPFFITDIAPATAKAGDLAVITGTNLAGATAVTVNGVAATGVTAVDATHVSFVVPAGASANQAVTVTTPAGVSPAYTRFTVQLQVISSDPVPHANSAPTANSALSLVFSEPLAPASGTPVVSVFSEQVGGRKAGQVSVSRLGRYGKASYTSTLGGRRANFQPGEKVRVSVLPAAQNPNGLASNKYVYEFRAATSGSGRGNFQPPAANASIGVGSQANSQPNDVAVGDVDGDGDLDMLSANTNDNSVSVRLNDGTGSFTAPATNAEISGVGQARQLVLGDADGDGDLDMFVVNASSVVVGLNNGTGNFAIPQSQNWLLFGTGVDFLTLGDVDGDGNLDVLAIDFQTNKAYVRLNDGTGRFTAPETNADITLNDAPGYPALGDVDNDGDLDLLVTGFRTNTVSVRLNDGTGNFTAPTTNATVPVGAAPAIMAVGDVNGDGNLDLLTANQDGYSVSIRLNDGTGHFTAPATNAEIAFPRDPYKTPYWIALGDVDADGDLDVLVTFVDLFNNGTVSVRLNNGTGSFTAPATNASIDTGGQRPYGLAMGDLDGDGDLDMLIANSLTGPSGGGNVTVRLNQVPATPLPVELTAFTATAEGTRAVRLAWATASEKNSQFFEVERSLDGRAFARIGTVAAAGSSSNTRAYKLLDANPPIHQSTIYYRLRPVDLDGSATYSPVRTVALTGAAAGLSLYPNPARGGAATLTGAQPGTVATVFDALGREVTQATADAAGTAALALPAGLPAGVYVVRAGTKAVRLTVE
jgi:hypothetical protein